MDGLDTAICALATEARKHRKLPGMGTARGGENMGTSGAALDDSILDVVSSASIACGGHAGDLKVMQRTVDSAARRGVAIGAHPSYPDRENFGRREMQIAEEELEAELVSQIEALAQCC